MTLFESMLADGTFILQRRYAVGARDDGPQPRKYGGRLLDCVRAYIKGTPQVRTSGWRSGSSTLAGHTNSISPVHSTAITKSIRHLLASRDSLSVEGLGPAAPLE